MFIYGSIKYTALLVDLMTGCTLNIDRIMISANITLKDAYTEVQNLLPSSCFDFREELRHGLTL